MTTETAPFRTHTCGELRREHARSKVTLAGWVDRVVPGKAVVLRDRHGKTICAIAPKVPEAARAVIASLSPEDYVRIHGAVIARKKANPDLLTGAVIVVPLEVERISAASDLPFAPGRLPEDEALRLAHRHLTLRAPGGLAPLESRFRAAMALREALWSDGFLEIETPLLEPHLDDAEHGPCVLAEPGRVFGLPRGQRAHEPMLLAGGFERVFQIARAFSADAPEPWTPPERGVATLTAAYLDEDDLSRLATRLVSAALAGAGGPKELGEPQTLTWLEAARGFGTDAPDLRYGLELVGVTEICRASDAAAFASCAGLSAGAFGVVVGSALPDEDLDALVDAAPGTTWIRHARKGAAKGPAAEGLEPHIAKRLFETLELPEGDAALVSAAAHWDVAARAMGRARVEIAPRLGLCAGDELSPVWVRRHPFFQRDLETGEPRIALSPRVALIDAHRGKVKGTPPDYEVLGKAFSLTLRGVCVASGAVFTTDRVHLQEVCRLLGYSHAEVDRAFGPALEAYRFGIPPHGGLVIELDRIAALALGASGVAAVQAFPKAADGTDPLTGAPVPADREWLDDLLEPL